MLARRLAPVQIHWIGFPGTIGGGLVDYIIADHRVIPDGAESFYVERIIRLPRCYQPNNRQRAVRSEEHTSELQSLMRISYAVFCLKKKNKKKQQKRVKE